MGYSRTMVRITSGRWGGRRIEVPPGEVRPTQERVREALFSSLAAWVDGAAVLDLYAGSGALGLEALSRGASRAVWVERAPRVARVLRANVAALAGTEAARDVVQAEVASWLIRRPHAAAPFDLVLADPPYEDAVAGPVLDRLQAGGWLAPGAMVVWEQRAGAERVDKPGWDVLQHRRYGDAGLVIYRAPATPESTS